MVATVSYYLVTVKVNRFQLLLVIFVKYNTVGTIVNVLH